MGDSYRLFLVKEANYTRAAQKNIYYMISSVWIQETKLVYHNWSQNSVLLSGSDCWLVEAWKTFWNVENALFLYLGGGYTGVYTCNHTSYILSICVPFCIYAVLFSKS